MSKQTRQQKKEEERRLIAEFEEEMKKNSSSSQNEKKTSAEHKEYDDTMPEKIHCRHCKTLMENGVCPTCGFRIYVPMSKEKRDKIRLIVAGVCMAVFVLLFIISQIQKG